MLKRTAVSATFDFEIGNLMESPCKRCSMRSYLPECTADCKMLDTIQKHLAGGISCAHSFSPAEPYTVSITEN